VSGVAEGSDQSAVGSAAEPVERVAEPLEAAQRDAPSTVLGRIERFAIVGSTNDIVRGWLAAGEPEVCVAVADEQSAGRGRLDRTWTAPAGAALLLSLGFRPAWLAPDRAWQLSALVALAMCDAAEDVAGLPAGTLRLKWPNDLVIETAGPDALLVGELGVDEARRRLAAPLELGKVAGLLGESEGLGTSDPRVVVGIGINADWQAADFPPELASSMTSLREASGGRPIDRDRLLDAFLERLEARILALRAGFFDIATWIGRQVLIGCLVRLEGYDRDGGEDLVVEGVDATTGALVVRHRAADGSPWPVHAGEVLRARLAGDGV
jgi:BirA family biotin operon repressor/biotin-[acetyl-CoA-carboxylase] ligase